ncbi:MAG: SBBP repeat-containing protein [Planctomycetota bacterium]|jgi:hypothetical protein
MRSGKLLILLLASAAALPGCAWFVIGGVGVAGYYATQEEPNAAPSTALTSPSGGEVLGGTQDVTWTTADNDPSTVDIELSADGGASWSALASGVPDTGRWSWDTTAAADGTLYRVRVRARDGGDGVSPWSASGADFAVDNTAPAVALTAPAGGEILGGVRAVLWTTTDAHPSVAAVEFSDDGGTSWASVTPAVPDTGSYLWDTSASADGTLGRIRVRATDAAGNVSAWDGSPADFELDNTAPVSVLTSPAGGEIWGGRKTITWTTTDANPSTVSVEVSSDSGGSWTAVTVVTDIGFFEWDTAANADGPSVRIRVRARDAGGNLAAWSATGADLTLDNTDPVTTLTFPAGGEALRGTQSIVWNTTDANPSTVDLEISSNSGATWAPLATGAADAGSYGLDTALWTDGALYRIRVRSADGAGNPSAWSESTDFIMDNTNPVVTLTSPLGGEAYSDSRNVTWNTTDLAPGTVDVEVSSNSGGTWSPLAAGAADTGVYLWDTTASTPGDAYRIRVTALDAAGNMGTASASASDFHVLRYDWTRAWGAAFTSTSVKDVAVDGSGNVYVTGYFSTTVDFEADWGGADPKTSAGQIDIFVVKVLADGSYGWARRIGGITSDVDPQIAVDGSGNVLVSGEFGLTTDFRADWGGGTDTKTSAGASDVFVTKINADGSYGWTHRLGGTSWDENHGITADGSGNIYVVGSFLGTVDFRNDWGGGTDSKTAINGYDLFLIKINADGSYGVTRHVGGTGSIYGLDVASGVSNDVFVFGQFEGTVDFQADWGGVDPRASAGSRDLFLLRVNANGTYGWVRRMGGSGLDRGNRIALDPAGNPLLVGNFPGVVDFQADFSGGPDSKSSAGGEDAFVMRVLSNGSYGWTRRIGGSGGDGASGIAVDGSGNAYVTGSFSLTVDFMADWGGGSDPRTSAGSFDAFLTRINSDGSYGWTRRVGGTVADGGVAVAVSGSGRIAVVGGFRGTVDFRADWGGTDSKTPLGTDDNFLIWCR